jgi:Na+(H+)/acetate symporter ActP
VAIGWLYLMPPFQGAGLALGTVAGTEPWVGGLLVAVVVLVNVMSGGMRSITFVQAFQYWLKLTALLVPVMFLLVVWAGDGAVSPADALPTAPSDCYFFDVAIVAFIMEVTFLVIVW